MVTQSFPCDILLKTGRIWYFILMGKSTRKKSGASGGTTAAEGEGVGLHGSCDTGMPQESAADKTHHFNYYLAGAVSLITFVVYLTSLKNGFVNWDDAYYVVANPHIRALDLRFLRWAFFDFYAGNWHPLAWISHALDYAVWGLNPLGHHLTNNILHAANTFMVVVLAVKLVNARSRKATGNGLSGFPSGNAALVAGAVTGLLFGLHPLHVESVAWVSERKDLLCALFFLFSISRYLKYVDHISEKPVKRRATLFFSDKRYLSAIGFFVLALVSKPMAITLPFVLLILDWYPFGRLRSSRAFRDALVEKLPFMGLVLVSSIQTIMAQRASGAVGNAPLSVRISVAFGSLVAYLWKIIVPVNLIPFYPFPASHTFSYSDYYPAVVLVAGLSAGCLALAGKRKLWPAVWCYYVVTLLPVLGIVQVGLQSMADRYTYLPALGPFLIIGLGAAWVSEKTDTLSRGGRAVKALSIAAAVFVVISMSYLTFRQIGIWKNGLALWNHQVLSEPEKLPLAYINRGVMFSQQEGRLDEAIADFDQAIALEPSNDEAYRQRALAYEKKGQADRAIEDFEKAITLYPPFDRAYKDPTYALTHIKPYIEMNIRLGMLYGEAGFFDKAINHFTVVVSLKPEDPLSYYNRGYTYFVSGQYDNALRDFDQAIELNQGYADAYLDRGYVYLKTGNSERATSDFRKACDLKSEGGCNALRALRQDTANRGK
jgi:tetratricopeptide (TPR) repeat protein